MQPKTRRVAVYLETHCNIGSKTAFPPAYSTDDTMVYLFTDAQAVYFMHNKPGHWNVSVKTACAAEQQVAKHTQEQH